jgi:hypothetical protein
MKLVTIDRRWEGRTVVVAATGPSLTQEVADRCRGHAAVAVSDAWRLLPWADVLYACDAAWWRYHRGVPDFAGERWTSHGAGNDKQDIASTYGLRCVAGAQGVGFSRRQDVIHYGHNSGFQALNLAILLGAARIVLVGFDMRVVDGRRHFHGDHPHPLINADPRRFVPHFERAAASLPAGVEILNATPGSALTCWPIVPLVDALHCDREAA